MKQSTSLFNFPDVNVWLALSYERHEHHFVARTWLSNLDENGQLYFSRFTQLGLLRLLTTQAVMRDEVMNQKQAWEIYDAWSRDDRVTLAEEPAEVEAAFRKLSQSSHPSPKSWADAYLAAFASKAGMSLITFDRGFRGKFHDLVLLPL
jgi:toxin-antitoxin system PIN domain toxin